MYCTTPETPIARKVHLCMSCGERIEPGQQYRRWRSFDHGDVGTNKMHPECLDMHNDEGGEWEYTPFSYERPKIEGATP